MYSILLFDVCEGRFIPNGCGSMWTRNRSTSTVWFSNSQTIKGLSLMRLSIDESKVQYLMPFDSQMVISKRQVDGFTSFTFIHDNDVKMSAIASQITGVYTVCSTAVTSEFPAQKVSYTEMFPVDDVITMVFAVIRIITSLACSCSLQWELCITTTS